MFKPTDRVQVREDFDADAPELRGREGVVVVIEKPPSGMILVRFPGWTGGHSGFSSQQDRSLLPRRSKEGWWLLETDLLPVEKTEGEL